MLLIVILQRTQYKRRLVKGSYYDICNAESEMLNKYWEFRRAQCVYQDAVWLFKSFNKRTVYYTTVKKYFDTNPRNDSRMIVELECIPKAFWGRGTGKDKQRFTCGQWQKLIRKLKDEMKQKNREYSYAYARFIDVSEGPQDFEKRKQEIKTLEEELKKANDNVVLIQNRLAKLKS